MKTNSNIHLERFFVEGLAHASYLVGANGEAAVIDPKRDVDDYLHAATKAGLRITAILETHPHADFVSGHLELAERTGAKIYISHRAPVRYQHNPVWTGNLIPVGSLKIIAQETPGHSPDSVSWVVLENDTPALVFTGDTLFVGDVGRPDLRDMDADPLALADALYDSLHEKLLKLPDDVRVYPAHGAGSLCGRKLGEAPYSTIGQERLHNWALQIKDRHEFAQSMVANLPERPAYFSHDVGVNLQGAKALAELPLPRELSLTELTSLTRLGAVLIDIRSAAEFSAGHVPGSLNIGVDSPLFSTWIGFLIPFGASLALAAADEKSVLKARLELARIGYDQVIGYVNPAHLNSLETAVRIEAGELRRLLAQPEPPVVLDVRTKTEWAGQHISGSVNIPLAELEKRLPELPRTGDIAVICGGGYRSSIGTSVLQKHGYENLKNVIGGLPAYEQSAPQG